MKIGLGATVKLFHLYPEGGPAPPMTSSICVFHIGISLGWKAKGNSAARHIWQGTMFQSPGQPMVI